MPNTKPFQIAQLNITKTLDGSWKILVCSTFQVEEEHYFDDILGANAKIGDYLLDDKWERMSLPRPSYNPTPKK